MPLLELEDVDARYGAVQALHGITLDVDERQVVSVLGANGAGKTTTLRAISGTVRRSGGLRFDGKTLPRSPEAVARLGIAHVPEGRGTFTELSVDENLKLGAYTRRDRSGYASDYEELLKHFPWLAERRDQQAGTLSGGEQQMLALARAFMARPRLILVDEPSLGLAPMVVQQLFDVLRAWIDEHGMSALVVEQNANVALAHSERGYVLEVGRVAVEDRRRAARQRVRPKVVPGLRVATSSNRSSGNRLGRGVRATRARARPDLPLDRRRQLRARRDGDVLDVHLLGAPRPRRAVLGRLLPHARDLFRRRRRHRAARDPHRVALAGLTVVTVTIGLLILLNGAAAWIVGAETRAQKLLMPGSARIAEQALQLCYVAWDALEERR